MSEEVCIPCIAVEAFCSMLPAPAKDKCRELVKKIEAGELTGDQARKIIESLVDPETLKKALAEAKKVADQLSKGSSTKDTF